MKLDTVGAVVSITIALAPAMLFRPDGTVVDVIALPAVSATVPIVKLETVRSEDVSDAPTVYVPVNVVPADAAVNSTVAPVSSVTVSVLPDWTASFVVAAMVIVAPCLYVPSAVDDENDEIVGAVVSITIAFAPAMLFPPDGTVVEVIALPTASATVPMVKFETVRSAEFCADVTVYVPVSVVPADAAVSSTVAPVSSVTVSVLPDWIASLVVAVMLIDAPALYDPSAVDEEKLDTVGAVTSRVIVVVAVAAGAGPVLPAASEAPADANTGMIVPPVVHVTVTVREAPESVSGAKVQVAVPLLEKSPIATPVTFSENVSAYVMLDAFVGDEAADVNDETVGAVVSMMIALAPSMLLAPDGTVVDVIVLPAVSATVPIVKLDTVRSAEFCVAATVYVPVSVVPAEAAVSSTVAPVSSVAVSVLPDWTASLVVAVMLIVAPALYEPSVVDDEKLDTVGAVESTVTDNALDVDVTTESSAVDATAVSECAPALNVPVVQDQAPVVSFARQVLPVSVPPSFSWTDAPGGAEPVNVSTVLVVRSSLFDAPVSEPASKSGTDTAGRAYRTTTIPDPPAPPANKPSPPAPPPPPPVLAVAADPAAARPPVPPPPWPPAPALPVTRLPPPPPPP